MKNVLLVGGTRTGKTTLANALRHEMSEINYIYLAKYSTQIPMTLQATKEPKLLEKSKGQYIYDIVENEDIELMSFSPEEMDQFSQYVRDKYGENIMAELALFLLNLNTPNLVDNIAKAVSVRFLKDFGFYVVGLHCDVKTQLQRRWKDRKDKDPSERSELERQIISTNKFFEIEECLKLASITYNTDRIRSDSPEVVGRILQEMNYE
ncbi:AAA family ATPase [Candidatus Woesearchaeota archaeon]|nr:AAA family ATPase [Candidatus Woesearchaeota archaeon]